MNYQDQAINGIKHIENKLKLPLKISRGAPIALKIYGHISNLALYAVLFPFWVIGAFYKEEAETNGLANTT